MNEEQKNAKRVVFGELEQGSDEWLAARCGVLTASTFENALKKGRKKGETMGEMSRMLAAEIAAERLSGVPRDSGATSFAMQRGIELEPVARQRYQLATLSVVDQVGFVRWGAFGCSPDGLIGEDGMLEIKCPINRAKHMTRWLTDDISDYLAQVEGQLWVAGREWCDLVSYHPDAPIGLEVYRQRVTLSEERAAEFNERLGAFESAVLEMVETLRKFMGDNAK